MSEALGILLIIAYSISTVILHACNITTLSCWDQLCAVEYHIEILHSPQEENEDLNTHDQFEYDMQEHCNFMSIVLLWINHIQTIVS